MGKGISGDLEAGTGQLYPNMIESPALRWAFIRKVYSIIAFQFLLTFAVAAVVVRIKPVSHFFVSSKVGLGVYIAIIIVQFILLFMLFFFQQRHPLNFLLLVLFTVAISFSLGITCAFTSGKVILEAAFLTAVMVVSLTLYTFWAARRGHDFSFLGPFLFASLLVLMVFGVIQIFFPFGKTSSMIFSCVAALIFCGYLVYDTDNLIKRYTYDEYIVAAVNLYLDILNLFMCLLSIIQCGDR